MPRDEKLRCWLTRVCVLAVAALVACVVVHDEQGFVLDDATAVLQLPPLTADSPPGTVPGFVVTPGHVRRTHGPLRKAAIPPALPRRGSASTQAEVEAPQSPLEARAKESAGRLALTGAVEASQSLLEARAKESAARLVLTGAAATKAEVEASQSLLEARAEEGAARLELTRVEAEAAAAQQEANRLEQQLSHEQGRLARTAHRWADGLAGAADAVIAAVGGTMRMMSPTCMVIVGMVTVLSLGFQASRWFAAQDRKKRELLKRESQADRKKRELLKRQAARPEPKAFFNNLQMCQPLFGCCLMASLSLSNRILFCSIYASWLAGLGLMWHLQILQPFVQQLAVVVCFASLVLVFVLLSAAEMYIILVGEMTSVFGFVSHTSHLVGRVMAALGFSQKPEPVVPSDPKEIARVVAGLPPRERSASPDADASEPSSASTDGEVV